MALDESSATVTLIRSGIDTVETVTVTPDGKIVGNLRVVPRPAPPDHDLSHDEKVALASALQSQIDANPDAFDTPALEAVVVQLAVEADVSKY